VTTWYGFFAPSGTPPAVIAKLNKVINDSLAEEVVRARLTTAGVVVKGSTPEAFGKHLANEYARWNAVREAAGIPLQ
jgi:tripartite-type tricarboxylate transporter receptor subunit TctC